MKTPFAGQNNALSLRLTRPQPIPQIPKSLADSGEAFSDSSLKSLLDVESSLKPTFLTPLNPFNYGFPHDFCEIFLDCEIGGGRSESHDVRRRRGDKVVKNFRKRKKVPCRMGGWCSAVQSGALWGSVFVGAARCPEEIKSKGLRGLAIRGPSVGAVAMISPGFVFSGGRNSTMFKAGWWVEVPVTKSLRKWIKSPFAWGWRRRLVLLEIGCSWGRSRSISGLLCWGLLLQLLNPSVC